MRKRTSFLRFIGAMLALMVFVAACTGNTPTPTATTEPETTTVAMEPTSQASPTPRQGDTRNSSEDNDSDGILNESDQCPEEGDMGYGVDAVGCPTDSDKDGYADHVDDCINEGDMGFGVDSVGCPSDIDGDGYQDHLDACPEAGDMGFGVDELGCPTDSDGDGYEDQVDFCPTEGDMGYGVDTSGCPVDTDGDGYQDHFDNCPEEGDMGYGVDAIGCPEDIDGDGIQDHLDGCPTEGDMGYGIGENGCPNPDPNPDPQPTDEPTQEPQPTDNVQPTDEPTQEPQPTDEPTPEETLILVNPDDAVAINMGINGYCQYFYTQPTAVFELTNPNESEINASYKDQDGNPAAVNIPAGGRQYVYVTPNGEGFASIKFDGVANYAEVTNCFTAQLSVTEAYCTEDNGTPFMMVTLFNSGPGTVQSGIEIQVFGMVTQTTDFSRGIGDILEPNESLPFAIVPDEQGFVRIVVADYNFTYTSTEPCLVAPTPEPTAEETAPPSPAPSLAIVSAQCVTELVGEVEISFSNFDFYTVNGQQPFMGGFNYRYQIRDDDQTLQDQTVLAQDGSIIISFTWDKAWRNKNLYLDYQTAESVVSGSPSFVSMPLPNCLPVLMPFDITFSQSCNPETGINTLSFTPVNYSTLELVMSPQIFSDSMLAYNVQVSGSQMVSLPMTSSTVTYDVDTNGVAFGKTLYMNPAFINYIAEMIIFGEEYATLPTGNSAIAFDIELCGTPAEQIGELKAVQPTFTCDVVNQQLTIMFDYLTPQDVMTIISNQVQQQGGDFNVMLGLLSSAMQSLAPTTYFVHEGAVFAENTTIIQTGTHNPVDGDLTIHVPYSAFGVEQLYLTYLDYQPILDYQVAVANAALNEQDPSSIQQPDETSFFVTVPLDDCGAGSEIVATCELYEGQDVAAFNVTGYNVLNYTVNTQGSLLQMREGVPYVLVFPDQNGLASITFGTEASSKEIVCGDGIELTPEATPELTPESPELTPEATETPGDLVLPPTPLFTVDSVTCPTQNTFTVQVTIGDLDAYMVALSEVLGEILPPEVTGSFDFMSIFSMMSSSFPVILTHTAPLTGLSPDLTTLAGMNMNSFPFTQGTHTFTITAGELSGLGIPGTGSIPILLPDGVPYYINMINPSAFISILSSSLQPLLDKHNRGETVTEADLSSLNSAFSSNVLASLIYSYEISADTVSSCVVGIGSFNFDVEVTAVCDAEAGTHTATFVISGADRIKNALGSVGSSIPFPYIINGIVQGQLAFADGSYDVVLNTRMPLSVQYMNPEYVNAVLGGVLSGGGTPSSDVPQLITDTFPGCGIAGGNLAFPEPPEITFESATCQGNQITLTVNFGDTQGYTTEVNEIFTVLLSGLGQNFPFDITSFVGSLNSIGNGIPVVISHTTPIDIVSIMTSGTMPTNLVGYGTGTGGFTGSQSVTFTIMAPPPDGVPVYVTFLNPYQLVKLITDMFQPLVDKFNSGEVITLDDVSTISSGMSSIMGNNPSALFSQLLTTIELDREALGDCLNVAFPDLAVTVTEECIGNTNRVTFTISGVTEFIALLSGTGMPANAFSNLPVQYVFSNGQGGNLLFADGATSVDIDTTGLSELSVVYLNLGYLSYQLKQLLGSAGDESPAQSLTQNLTVCSLATPVVTPTEELTPVVTPTEELTPVVTPTEELTPVVTPTEELTPVVTPTEELTPVVTPTEELTPVVTPTEELTPEVTPTEEATPTVEVTPTAEVTPTPDVEITATPEITPVVTIVVPTLDPLPTIELPELPTLPVIPTDNDGICGLTLPSLGGLPNIDLSGAGCVAQTERPVQNWSPITIGGAVCLPEIIYHTNETGDWELFWASANRAPENLSDGVGFIDLAPTRSPDGLWIAFSSNRDGNWEIYAATVDGSTVIRLTDNDSAVDFDPSWSPDGTKLVYESNVDGNWELRMINLLTGEKLRLTDSASPDINPAWHPDGTKIAFQSSRNDGLWQLYELDLPTGAITRLSDGTTDDTDPIYSPDGNSILYKSSTAELRSLAVMTREGVISTSVMVTNTNVASGIWSSDGAYIAYEETRIDGSRMIVIYEVATGATRQMTANGVDAFSPAWICESYNVAFTANILGNNDVFVLPAVPMDGAPYDMLTVEPAVGGDANQRDPQNSPSEENASRGGNLPPK